MNKRKLKGLTSTLLLTIALALTMSCVMAVAPEVWTTDSLGNPKDEFDVSDDVFVTGSGFPANTEITIYVWDPDRDSAVVSSSVITDGDGSIPVTLIWAGPLYKIPTAEGTIYRCRDYEYEIRVDGNGEFSFDVIYPEGHVIYPEGYGENPDSPIPQLSVPEPGTIFLMLAMFGALTTAFLARKRLF